MTDRHPSRVHFLASMAVLGLLAGCHPLATRSKEHSSAALLDSGSRAEVTKRQAADIGVALGRSQEEEGKPAEAEAAYLSALERDPKRADAEARLAVLLDKRGDVKTADKHFARALKLAPKDPEILCDRGYSYYLRRRWADAEDCLKKAISLSPSHARSHTNLGLVLARQGNSDEALKEFALAGCDPADARANLGLVYSLEGRLEDARKEYKLALIAKPKSTLATEGLRAASVALAGQDQARSLADSKELPTKADPAVSRASASQSR
ncbi:tetratricopeptide repeat protein [Tundrisphaera lichenicola]|uniref:tetratricopeptide repeat protein n=1 Tax=Tundrisphaera lichenicola TaxID=2029860 RepID=UPI003EB7A0AA